MLTEADIMHENGRYWVCRQPGAYTVFRISGVASYSDSSYAKDDDGLSLAIARCDYLARRDVA